MGEYPMRLHKICVDHGCFTGTTKTQGVWVNSEDYIAKFADCFPKYPKKNLVFSRIGVNQKIFRPKNTTIEDDLAKYVRTGDKGKLKDIKKVVTFVGKFADWNGWMLYFMRLMLTKNIQGLGHCCCWQWPP